MAKEKYVAYVSTYTQGDKHGIRVYDVDMEKGRFQEKDRIEITNSSYLTSSRNGKYLYSITDFGVESFRILKDGNLEFINFASINGMRGCYLSTDYTDRYLFVSGYHDGKLTVLRLGEDGAVGEITEEIYHRGMSCIAERNSRPHITCARMTRDNKYLLVADQGMDHINVYSLDLELGKVKLADIIHCDLAADPRHIRISGDGRFLYILEESKCTMDVYSYEDREDNPYFERLQTIPVTEVEKGSTNTACALRNSMDYQYLIASVTGKNAVTVFKADEDTGLLTKSLSLPIGGEYPKDADFFPDRRFIVSLNHESNNMTFFRMDVEAGTLIMNGPPMPVAMPNSILFHRIQ